MSLDGLSYSNLGIYRPVTPAEVAQQAEKASQLQAQKIIKEVDELANLKLNPDGKNNQQNNHSHDNKNEEAREELSDEMLEDESKLKRFSVKFNNHTNLVELVDKTTGFIIETITPEDLISLMSKSKDPSGILVDRQI